MPPGRPHIDLVPYQQEIIELYNSGNKPSEIAEILLDKYNLAVKPRIIKQRLQEWHVWKITITENNPRLCARIKVLYFQCCLSDDDMLYVL
jgi:hypothetical protein